MRKALIPLMFSLIAYTFSSCKYYAPVPENIQDDNIYTTVTTEIHNDFAKERWDWDDSDGDECALKVMDCFINKDSETLKEMFCSKAKIRPDFDEQINEAFEFIDGNIISYDDYIASMDEVAYEEGKAVERYYVPIIDDIKTDKNRTYKIAIRLYTVFDEDEGRVGITSVTIRENDDNIYRFGLPEYLD